MQHSSEVLGVTSENAVSVSPLRFAMRDSQSKQAKADATSNNQASKWLDTKHKAMRMNIIMLLDQKPERMDAVLDLLSQDIQPKRGASTADSSSETFWHTLMRLHELPKRDFWKLLVQEACKSRKWTEKQWSNILSEKTTLNKLVVFLFCVEMNWRIPKPMYNKKFAWKLVLWWANKHNLYERVLKITLKPDGKIDWDVTGPYELLVHVDPNPSPNAGTPTVLYKRVRHVGGHEVSVIVPLLVDRLCFLVWCCFILHLGLCGLSGGMVYGVCSRHQLGGLRAIIDIAHVCC